jgi:hypothetical protein
MFEFLRRIACVDDSAYSFGRWWAEHQVKLGPRMDSVYKKYDPEHMHTAGR